MSNPKKPHFLVVFLSNLSLHRLQIPSRFMKHMQGKTSGVVSLTGPSGNTWQVDLIQIADELFFHNGWGVFVKDHCIEGSDSLVFRYDGDLHFTVQIFDQSSCEKEAAFHAGCPNRRNSGWQMGEKRERDSETHSSDTVLEGVPKKMKEISQNVGLDVKTCSNKCNSPSTDAADLASLVQSKACLETPVIQGSPGIEDGPGSHARGCMAVWSAPDEKRAAQGFTSSFPYFVRIMKKFNVSGCYTLNIPSQFCRDNLPTCKTKIDLCNLKGESWSVNSVPTTKVQTFHTICGGWMAFVRANDIMFGDVCIFELMEKYKLRVHVFRNGKARLESQTEKASKNALNVVPISSHGKTYERVPKKMKRVSQIPLEIANKVVASHKDGLQNEVVMEEAHQEDSILSETMKLGPLSKKNGVCEKSGAAISKKISSKYKKSLLAGGCMSIGSTPEEEKAAQWFTSQFPYFVRAMKNFNVSSSYTLKIPYKFCTRHLPKSNTKIILHNLKGESWSVNSIATTRVQTYHTMCGGWGAFVRANDIKLGDICIFELVGKCELRVHIFGVGKEGPDFHSGRVAVASNGLGTVSSTC